MLMANKLKVLVSKKKQRYQENGFDLDLTYITDNIIAMGFPAEKLEGYYRNHIDDVVRFFDRMHPKHYKIYNLCDERSYSPEKFDGEVVKFPFEDHNVPDFKMIHQFCVDVDEYLKSDSKNVAAIHCKAGKGRTGLMISAYLVYSNHSQTAEEALNFYGMRRTSNRKGVTIPSQQRYVHYYAHLIRHALDYQETTLLLEAVRFQGVPTPFSGTCTPCYTVFDSGKSICESPQYEIQRQVAEIDLSLNSPAPVKGDIKIEFYNKRLKKDKMFHLWINTFFVVHPIPTESEAPGSSSPNLSPDNHTGSRRTKPSFTSSHTSPLISRERSSSGTPLSNINENQSSNNHLASQPELVFSPGSRLANPLGQSGSFAPVCRQSGLSQSSEAVGDGGLCAGLRRQGSELSHNRVNDRQRVKYTITLGKMELDKAIKDVSNKLFPKDFKVTFFFTSYSASSDPIHPHPANHYHCSTLPLRPHHRTGDIACNLAVDEASTASEEETDTDADEPDGSLQSGGMSGRSYDGGMSSRSHDGLTQSGGISGRSVPLPGSRLASLSAPEEHSTSSSSSSINFTKCSFLPLTPPSASSSTEALAVRSTSKSFANMTLPVNPGSQSLDTFEI